MTSLVERLFGMSGRTVLVTGGGRGLGKDFAFGLAEAGAHVVIGSRKVRNCSEVAREIDAFGGSAEAHELDVADPASIDALVAKLDEKGVEVDTLINNAGITWGAPFFDHPLSAWDKVFNVNVRGTFYMTQQVARRMRDRKKGGLIVNIGSIAGLNGAPDGASGTPAYVASKAAVMKMTQDFAIKLAPHRIRVNGIAPGPFLTDMFNWVKGNEAFLKRMNEAVPVGHIGATDDLKTTVLYLCSSGCTYLTGQVIALDGGIAARLANY
jgi:gluconate 5-dehydrogenase